MPHSKSGQLIEVGDIVHGRGYNIDHDIIGEVLHVNPSSDSCNIQVAVVQTKPLSWQQVGFIYPSPDRLNAEDHSGTKVLVPGVEYGACKDFEIIKKYPGNVAISSTKAA